VFTESLLESSVHSRRGWTTMLSFAVQAVAVAALILLPLFHTRALPAIVALGSLIGPPPGEPPRAAANEQRQRTSSTSEVVGNTVREPMQIRKGVANINDEVAPVPAPYTGTYVPGSIGSGDSAVISLLGAPAKPPSPPTPTRPATPLKISGGVSQGLLIQQVRPVYPPIAVMGRIQGAVVLNAVISRSGAIENLRVLSGHPLLVAAALDAVRQWRYRPYLLNGEPVEVETQITSTSPWPPTDLNRGLRAV
jgi:periplasmic protein TonB